MQDCVAVRILFSVGCQVRIIRARPLNVFGLRPTKCSLYVHVCCSGLRPTRLFAHVSCWLFVFGSYCIFHSCKYYNDHHVLTRQGGYAQGPNARSFPAQTGSADQRATSVPPRVADQPTSQNVRSPVYHDQPRAADRTRQVKPLLHNFLGQASCLAGGGRESSQVRSFA